MRRESSYVTLPNTAMKLTGFAGSLSPGRSAAT
jgi:hypothetical protein